jgi:hypothetical protein
MSNYPPPNNPLSSQPFQPTPPVGPPYQTPPKKKSKALFWVLGGCGTITVIGAIVVIGIVWWGWNKAKEIGLDPELMDKHPAVAAAKIMAATNPDVEVVSVDEDKELITIKDKKTGEIVTLTLNEARSGKVTISTKDKGNVTIDAKGDAEKGSVEIKSDEGTAKFGTGTSVTLPDWLPSYPGATPQGTYSVEGKDGQTGSYQFTTKDSIDQVVSFYEDGLKSRGLKVSTSLMRQDGKVSGATITAQGEDNKRTSFVSVIANQDGNQVSVTFEAKK